MMLKRKNLGAGVVRNAQLSNSAYEKPRGETYQSTGKTPVEEQGMDKASYRQEWCQREGGGGGSVPPLCDKVKKSALKVGNSVHAEKEGVQDTRQPKG